MLRPAPFLLLALYGARSTSAKTYSLLPLGDSITFGCGDYCGGATEPNPTGCNGSYGVGKKCCAKEFGTPKPHPWTPCMGCSGGYRQPLFSRLDAEGPGAADGDAWKFVGTVKQQGGVYRGDHHDGHPGWRIDQVQGDCWPPADKACQGGNSSFFRQWTALKPDYIVLMIGTNDIGQLYNTTCDKTATPWKCEVAPIASRLEALLRATYAALPHVHIFLSDLVGIGPRPCYGPDGDDSGWGLGETMVQAFNARLPQITQRMIRAGHQMTHIPLANMTGLGQGGKDLCPCDYHPTHAGYKVMAGAIFDSICKAHARAS